MTSLDQANAVKELEALGWALVKSETEFAGGVVKMVKPGIETVITVFPNGTFTPPLPDLKHKPKRRK